MAEEFVQQYTVGKTSTQGAPFGVFYRGALVTLHGSFGSAYHDMVARSRADNAPLAGDDTRATIRPDHE